jgi:hypothetical protein
VLDQREILSAAGFERFARLRALRKQLADTDVGLLVKTILTNAHRAAIFRWGAPAEGCARPGRRAWTGPERVGR